MKTAIKLGWQIPLSVALVLMAGLLLQGALVGLGRGWADLVDVVGRLLG